MLRQAVFGDFPFTPKASCNVPGDMIFLGNRSIVLKTLKQFPFKNKGNHKNNAIDQYQIQAPSAPAYLWTQGPKYLTDADKYAKAFFKEQDLRKHQSERAESLGMDVLSPAVATKPAPKVPVKKNIITNEHITRIAHGVESHRRMMDKASTFQGLRERSNTTSTTNTITKKMEDIKLSPTGSQRTELLSPTSSQSSGRTIRTDATHLVEMPFELYAGKTPTNNKKGLTVLTGKVNDIVLSPVGKSSDSSGSPSPTSSQATTSTYTPSLAKTSDSRAPSNGISGISKTLGKKRRGFNPNKMN